MSEWVDVVSQDALAEGEHVVVDVDGVEVAVFNLEGSFYAIEDVCSHDGAEIASGELQGDEIVCPRHGARFCVKTGQVKSAPAYEDIACFKVRIEDKRVQVRDDRWD
ncbi:non-heme iron oxygenase ferredoxin subunit [Methylicorpusculum sp.]|uniref:non-heme iron oxygenase ferredoxin subunit n=1 Tax=Methylicorpusculum sp. TaxID=2713644 RepID=UPI0027304435|nr:non-heme iron oxygenase ferredoxin subunit [Methylicorpusculum sp.]MDP2176951.1 non-heme iron oxygenase ferredoxin subunit [Methylicorpusculum sp.]MDP3528721.1 non-heme iron oxygenase ferredoxin subunit [Methylicorpusculum sp.]MDZ4149922.1 non-heme iron oxygenase ferredoxin subunit [Methylicorpusculum sp.]